MNTKIELRFVRQKDKEKEIDNRVFYTTKKVLQMRYVADDGYGIATDWQTVPFDESVMLDDEGNEL